MMNNIRGIQKTLEQSYEWVKILMMDYDFSNENKAFVVLRATLKALRDRVQVGEAIHLGSQLPALLRGFYYEGWDPYNDQDKSKSMEDFLHLVRFHLNGHDDVNLMEAVPATLKLIMDMIDQGEAREIRASLPREVRSMCP